MSNSTKQRDVLFFGGSGGELWMPDAVANFKSSLSAESGVRFPLRGKSYAPMGTDGEVVFRRILLTGYHRTDVSMWVTPILHGRYLHDIRTYVQSPAPKSGKMELFEFLVPLAKYHEDYPGFSFGLRGSVIDCYIETKDPVDEWHLETVTYLYEPLTPFRGARPNENRES